MASSYPKKTAWTSEEEEQLEGTSLTAREETNMEEFQKRNKYLEDKISKAAILFSDQDELKRQEIREQGADVEMRKKYEILMTEYDQLKVDNDGNLIELQSLRRQNESLAELKGTLQDITNLSRTQQTTILCLKDEVSAVRLMAAENQLRQLNEIESLTEENKELKETLVALIGQHQQPTTDEHHHGNIILYIMRIA